MTSWVVDTGPLLFLAKLDWLDLLRSGADVIYVPRSVLAEVRVKRDTATYAIEHACQNWLVACDVIDRRAVDLVQADLDLGEAEVIVLARELAADRAVLDDLDARRFARRVGLEIVGTVGLLLAAHERGELASLRAEIERLESLGFHIAPSLAEAVFRAAGE